jgi:gamma-glutamyltranspeptidase/glutathione hydrolase
LAGSSRNPRLDVFFEIVREVVTMSRNRLLFLLLFLLTVGVLFGQAPQRYERVMVGPAHSTQTMRPVIRGTQYAVTSMASQATMAAERMLRSGGNAFDAIVAGQAVLALVDAASNGIGSDAVLLVYSAAQKKVWSLNAEGTAPKLATIDWYKKHQNGRIPVDDTLLAATVPGVVDAWSMLLTRWGTKSFTEVLAPAIDLAERGYPLSEAYARHMGSEQLLKYPSSARVYAPGGKRWKEGEVFKNPDFARTLRRLADAEKDAKDRETGLKMARDRFYKGDIAREMTQFSEQNGGLLRFEDFASYTAKLEEPVSLNYRGYEVYKNPSSSQGPSELFALNILERYDLKAMGHNSADYIHTNVEAMKLAMADRDTYLGDMDFIRIPFTGLLSKQYAEERRRLISPDKASFDFRPGRADKYEPGFDWVERPRDINIEGNGEHNGDTSYIAVVDQAGNAITFTPSLHSGFGTKVVVGNLGFVLNCRGDYFSLVPGHANALEPGKRPRSTLQGTLVTKGGKPFLLTGSPGGDDQCMRTIQTFLNVVEFGMNIQQAIEAPRWSTESFPSSPFPHTMYPGVMSVESRVPENVRAELVRRGHKLFVNGPWTMGSNGAILIDPATGSFSAGADPRVSAQALAW